MGVVAWLREGEGDGEGDAGGEGLEDADPAFDGVAVAEPPGALGLPVDVEPEHAAVPSAMPAAPRRTVRLVGMAPI